MSRTFGDIDAKAQALGGNPLVVIAVPEITSFRLDAPEMEDSDFILMASKWFQGVTLYIGDGIFDKLNNDDVTECVWMSVRDVSKESHMES